MVRVPYHDRQGIAGHFAIDRGVSRLPSGRWRARVQTARGNEHLGVFQTELEAARAAEAHRREHLPFAEPDPELTRRTP